MINANNAKYLLFTSFIFILISFFLNLKIHELMPVERQHFEVDSVTYDYFANNFAKTNSLVDPKAPSKIPTIALGYPLILGTLYKIFYRNLDIILIFQIILSLLCMLLIFNICLYLFNLDVAVIALIISSLNLGFLIYSQYILTEITLVTFLLLFCERFIKFYMSHSLYALFAAGFFLGCSIAIKPAALFYFLIPALMISFISNNKANAKLSLIFICAFSIVPMLYIFRNKLVYDSFSICPLAKTNLHHYFLPKLISSIEDTSEQEALKKVRIMQKPERELKILVKKYPTIAAQIWIKNVFKTFFGLHTTALKRLLEPKLKSGECSFFKVNGSTFFERIKNYIEYGTNSIGIQVIGFLEFITILACYLLSAITLFNLGINKRWFILSFILSFIFYFTIITGHDGCGRFRMMIEPWLIICEAAGIYLIYSYFISGNKNKIISY